MTIAIVSYHIEWSMHEPVDTIFQMMLCTCILAQIVRMTHNVRRFCGILNLESRSESVHISFHGTCSSNDIAHWYAYHAKEFVTASAAFIGEQTR